MKNNMMPIVALSQNEINAVFGGVEKDYALAHQLLPLSPYGMVVVATIMTTLTAVVCDKISVELVLFSGLLGGGISYLKKPTIESSIDSGAAKAMLAAGTAIVKKLLYDDRR